MKIKFIFFVLAGLASSTVQSKLLIFTYAFNRPDFIEIQKKTFDKFLTEEYDFVVFNDAKEDVLKNEIIDTCNRLEIEHVLIPQSIHSLPYLQRWSDEDLNDPAVRNCNAVQYSLNEYGFKHNDIILLIDSDCFLVKPFDIRKHMHNYHISAIMQSRNKSIEYFWIGLVFMDFGTMPNKNTINFNCGRVNEIGVDAGGHTHNYIQDNPNLKINNFGPFYPNELICQQCSRAKRLTCLHTKQALEKNNVDPKTISFIQAGPANYEFLLNSTFLHYRGGTNWDNQTNDYHHNKTAIFNNYINSII